jgi:proteasome lid subunit RPN8/RPN11
MDAALHKRLWRHLLPTLNALEERAAFLFVSSKRTDHQVVFGVLDSYQAGTADLVSQSDGYLELGDEARAKLIKRAHDLGASLVEIHSHPGPWPAAFSLADRVGLRETVHHMWWRLKGRPYLALVFAQNDFDAFVWLDHPKFPRLLDGLLVGERRLLPTNNSLEGW